MTRVSNFALQSFLQSQTLGVQARLADLQIQASSGLKAQTYAGIATDAHQLVSLETAHAQTAQYVKTNQTVDSRLTSMESSVSDIFKAATNFRTLLLNAENNSNAGDLSIDTEAGNFRQQIANLLNVQVDGRYLFSGSRTDLKPVDLAGWTTPPTLTPPLTLPLPTYTAEYYKGDSQVMSAQIDTSLTINYGVTADNPAFEYLLRAAYYIQQAGPTPSQDEMETALSLINTALGTENGNSARGVQPLTQDIADIQSQIGTSRSAIDSANSRHSDFTIYLEQNIADIKTVDVAQTLTQVSSYTTQLQASYMTLSQISQLSLLNYLK
ncbi:MAG TPA: flagellin [Hypericibacter adhaerens]|jgi:flagellar hook-associated protein 3 FlgL|uniref:Flagellin n=1 Tax=Hypericibacter adhaerens TaxID=2602016 RepID=A0A5J6N0L6_9PROT|nr:flagellin [Hypericibacter adhaerens]QEX23538.1 flagellin [Hypericibacter adhaerens]HWA43300.1 flagellin [Hypericibacter adhaerens]